MEEITDTGLRTALWLHLSRALPGWRLGEILQKDNSLYEIELSKPMSVRVNLSGYELQSDINKALKKLVEAVSLYDLFTEMEGGLPAPKKGEGL